MLACHNIAMSFGPKILFKDVSLHLAPKERFGLVGANGCGKSTFLKILAQELSPQEGALNGAKNLKVGRLVQDHFAFDSLSLIAVTLMGNLKLYEALALKESYLKEGEEDPLKWAAVEEIIAHYNGYQAHSLAAKLLIGLGFSEEQLEKPMSYLSGGWRMRVLLAQLLFGQPDLLLLDEPTNHLDLPSIRWLEKYLLSFEGIVIVASHDRGFLNAVTTHILDLDYQTITAYRGNYDAFEKIKAEILAEKSASLANKEKKIAHMQEFVDRFGAKATKAKQAQSRARMIEKLNQDLDAGALQDSVRQAPYFSFPLKRASGVVPISVKNLSFSYGAKEILKDVQFSLARGDRLAVIGPNGAGKSTLLSLIAGALKPNSGEIQLGYEVKLGFLAQNLDQAFKGKESVFEWLMKESPSILEQDVRRALGQVLFSNEEQKKSASFLSGGEKARLMLAKIMLEQPNLLLLDEPTNHLDIEAIDALILALQDYKGTLLFVSHSTYFLEKVASRILEVSSSSVLEFQGNFSALEKLWEAQEKEKEKKEKEASFKAPKNDWEERKKERGQQKALKKQLETVEKLIAETESKLASLHEQMASGSFYAELSLADQQKIADEEAVLQSHLNASLQQWEQLMSQMS